MLDQNISFMLFLYPVIINKMFDAMPYSCCHRSDNIPSIKVCDYFIVGIMLTSCKNTNPLARKFEGVNGTAYSWDQPPAPKNMTNSDKSTIAVFHLFTQFFLGICVQRYGVASRSQHKTGRR